MTFFNFDLGSVSRFTFYQKYLKNKTKNAEFSAIFAYNSGNAINPGGFSNGDCRAHTCGDVGPLDGRICPCGRDILRPECENTCP